MIAGSSDAFVVQALDAFCSQFPSAMAGLGFARTSTTPIGMALCCSRNQGGERETTNGKELS
jgi:hypothetical protein